MPYFSIKFIVNGEKIEIQGKNNEYMKDIINRLGEKINEDINNYLFLYEGLNVNQNLTLEEMTKDNNNDITILVYDDKVDKSTYVGSKYIICPVCKKDCVIKIKDYKINLEECDQDHRSSNIYFTNIEDYKNNQLIDQSKIICSFCKENNKYITYGNKFYKCITCNKDICPLCKSKHEIKFEVKHNIIDYDDINFVCSKHSGERYNSYCMSCHQNLCIICEKEHKKHSCISFSDLIPEDNNLHINEFEKTLKYFKNEISELKNILYTIEDNMDKYLEMIIEIKNYYNIRNRNYQILQNINNIYAYNKEVINDMTKIINRKDQFDKFKDLIDIYIKMTPQKIDKTNNNICNINNNSKTNSNNNNNLIKSHLNNQEISGSHDSSSRINEEESSSSLNNDKQKVNIQLKSGENNSFTNVKKKRGKIVKTNEIILQYKNNNNERDIMLLGKKFIKNNKDICLIFFNGKQQELRQLYDKRRFNITNETLEVKLRFSSQLIDMSYMFNDCSSLISIEDIDRIDTSEVTNMAYLFCGCNSLEELPDISIWDTSNVTNMRYIFGDCTSLKELPDISDWDISQVTNLSCFLCECKKIRELPDISKWNTSKVTDLSSMFTGCSKLSKIPDFHKWDVSNVTNASYMFHGCSSLPENIISQFNFKDGVNKDYFN